MDDEFRREYENRPTGPYTGVADDLQLPVTSDEYDHALHHKAEARYFHETLTELMRDGSIHLTPEQVEVVGRVALSVWGHSLDGTRRALEQHMLREPFLGPVELHIPPPREREGP